MMHSDGEQHLESRVDVHRASGRMGRACPMRRRWAGKRRRGTGRDGGLEWSLSILCMYYSSTYQAQRLAMIMKTFAILTQKLQKSILKLARSGGIASFVMAKYLAARAFVERVLSWRLIRWDGVRLQGSHVSEALQYYFPRDDLRDPLTQPVTSSPSSLHHPLIPFLRPLFVCRSCVTKRLR
jgi:hypothetical protein